MLLTDLTKILDAAGVEYEGVDGWRTRSLNRAGLNSNIKAQMFHTTETADSSFDGRDAPTLGYVTNGLGYPLYNLLYGRSGKVYIIAAGSAAHAGNGSGGGMGTNNANREAIAHSFDANEHNNPVTQAQLVSAAKVGKAADDYFGGLVTIMHGEWNSRDRRDPTKVPGGWDALKSAVKSGKWGGGGASSGGGSKPKKSTNKRPSGPGLAVDGICGPLTVNALQRALGVTVDGLAGPQTWTALQRKLSAPFVDGVISRQYWSAAQVGRGIVARSWEHVGRGATGSQTVNRLQRHVGASADSIWYRDTTRALQRALNNGKF